MKKVIAISFPLLILITSLAVLFFFNKGDNCDFLINADWEYYDQNIGETIGITFTKDGNYFYNCSCGEPIGDSDLYDEYKYNAKKNIITLYGPDDYESEIKILYGDKFYLVLKFPEYTRVFKNEENKIQENFDETTVGLEKETSVLLAVLEFKNNEIKVAPLNYDGDTKEMFEENIFSIKAAENATFENVTEKFVNGKRTERTQEDLNEKDYQYFGEYYTHGYTVFNDEGLIEKIIFYGLTEIYE